MKPAPRSLLSLLFTCAAACGGSTVFGIQPVRVLETSYPASCSQAPVTSINWFVYFAEEALAGPGGTDLNGDGDRVDEVAVAVRIGSHREELLGVAARGAALAREDVWLVVDEADDGRDWNGSGTSDDVVLLHWEVNGGILSFVDTLADDGAFLVLEADERVYYASADPSGTGDVTNLRYVSRSAPTVPVAIANEAGGGSVRARLIGEEDELLVFVQDEGAAGRDLNGDGDAGDASVLGLLDGERTDSVLRNLGLAVFDADVPWDARREGDTWLFGVLVNEAAQGANLNTASLFGFPLLPDTCAADDTDTDDDVLFFARFPAFDIDGGLGNTGLAGVSRVVVVEDFVATLSPEADAGGCDLNDDGDTADLIVRWARASATGGVVDVQPPRDSRLLVPVDPTLPGGSFGLAPLARRLVALVDEAGDARDFDGRPGDSRLVAWIDPRNALDAVDTPASNWAFAHQDGSNVRHGTGIFASDGTSEPYASATWMGTEEREGRLPLAFDESLPGANPLVGSLNNNVNCTLVQKDTDITDALPVWLDFEGGPTLDFDGVGFATPRANPGLVVFRGFAYFRVSEAEDNRDYTADGDLDDVVLVRNPLISCDPEVLGEVSSLPGPAIFFEEVGARGAVFLSTGIDFDGDGNPAELVVRHFVF